MSKNVKRVIFSILFILVLVASWYYGGFFTRYNYLTARWDVFKNRPTLVEFGEPNGMEGELKILAPKIGVSYDYAGGCTISQAKANGIGYYNKVMEPFLTVRLEKGWKGNLYKQADSLYYLDRIDAMSKAVLATKEVSSMNKYLDSTSNGKMKINVWILSQRAYKKNLEAGYIENASVGWIRPDSSKIIIWHYAVDPHSLGVSSITY